MESFPSEKRGKETDKEKGHLIQREAQMGEGSRLGFFVFGGFFAYPDPGS